MRPIKTQFFLSFGVVGSLTPLMPLLLTRGKGLTPAQLGTAMALMSGASLLSPVIITLLADTRSDPRRLLAGSLLMGALALVGIHFATASALVIALVGFYGLALVAVIPLQDGFYFSAARSPGTKLPPPSYPLVRVWGTAGFIVPSIILYFAMEAGAPVPVILAVGLVYCALGAANTFLLRPLPALPRDATKRLPTWEAARALFGSEARWFCLALAMAHAAAPAFYAFFPLYLKERTGVPESTIGLIFCYGVFFEIFVSLAIPRLSARFGFRPLFLLGFGALAFKMVVMASSPGIGLVMLAQTFHGVEVMALYILPVIYLNSLATDRFRNSIQGVYGMLVSGGAKIIGYQVAGFIAGYSLTAVFAWGAGLALAALAIFALGFKPARSEAI
ncbi:hypothetical protein BH23VER1_BH23VER1_30580 [soil metagenome]